MVLVGRCRYGELLRNPLLGPLLIDDDGKDPPMRPPDPEAALAIPPVKNIHASVSVAMVFMTAFGRFIRGRREEKWSRFGHHDEDLRLEVLRLMPDGGVGWLLLLEETTERRVESCCCWGTLLQMGGCCVVADGVLVDRRIKGGGGGGGVRRRRPTMDGWNVFVGGGILHASAS